MKPNTSYTIEMPASLRSDGVRPGMPFGFPRETAFGFAGILTRIAAREFINPALCFFYCEMRRMSDAMDAKAAAS
jgi:hypothetical protein